MLCWEEKALPLPVERRFIDARSLAWLRQLRREWVVAAIPYIPAHLIAAGADHLLLGYPKASLLLIAQLLFILGPLLFVRVVQRLEEPLREHSVNAPPQAGLYLAGGMALALSPGIWWLAGTF
jgi:hypothetical protein